MWFQLNPRCWVMRRTLSAFSKLTERNSTSGNCSFHSERIGISRRQGPQPENQALTTTFRPLMSSSVHGLPSMSYSAKCPGKDLPTSSSKYLSPPSGNMRLFISSRFFISSSISAIPFTRLRGISYLAHDWGTVAPLRRVMFTII